jgi:hypothetical protein
MVGWPVMASRSASSVAHSAVRKEPSVPLPQQAPLQARPHHRPEGRDLAQGGDRGQRPRLVQRRRPAASVERRDRPRAHRVDEEKKYSWVKAPRYDGQPAQVGPLADALAVYAQARRLRRGQPAHEEVDRRRARKDLRHRPRQSHPGHAPLHPRTPRRPRHPRRRPLRAGPEAMATPHRHPQRRHCHLQQARVPQRHQRTRRFHEAPRGLLSHWVVIEDGTIKNYQAVVPTTWNASPRDTSGTLGPLCSSSTGPRSCRTRRRPRAPPRSPAHDSLLRSLHRLRSPHLRPLRPKHRESEDAVSRHGRRRQLIAAAMRERT